MNHMNQHFMVIQGRGNRKDRGGGRNQQGQGRGRHRINGTNSTSIQNGYRRYPHYCWTHEGGNHSGYDCNHLAFGHRPEATFENQMSGSNICCFLANTYSNPPTMYPNPPLQYHPISGPHPYINFNLGSPPQYQCPQGNHQHPSAHPPQGPTNHRNT
mmetsp:Transcript_2347/g.3282  ORF Transcript_2347/g.3282 Transcript_2347/m.3282 type:complete len:157 (+) Transcript_2347:791-1261(+)